MHLLRRSGRLKAIACAASSQVFPTMSLLIRYLLIPFVISCLFGGPRKTSTLQEWELRPHDGFLPLSLSLSFAIVLLSWCWAPLQPELLRGCHGSDDRETYSISASLELSSALLELIRCDRRLHSVHGGRPRISGVKMTAFSA